MASAIVEHMASTSIKSMGFIGYNDAFGEGFWREVEPLAQKAGIKVLASERYNRTDTSVTGQVLKLVSANPEAVLIVGSGTPAALPQITLAERGYKGRIYQSHGAANRDFLRVGGKNVEGALIPVGPMLVGIGQDQRADRACGLQHRGDRLVDQPLKLAIDACPIAGVALLRRAAPGRTLAAALA